MKQYRLGTIVFISGAVVMIFELVGSRILGPYVGTSIFVWTSLIGIILGSLSLGYWLGGKLADQQPQYHILAGILLTAALSIFLVAFVKEGVLAAIVGAFTDLKWSSVMGALSLFTVPSVLLGTVSPYAVRLRLEKLESSGQTVGNLYALSTVGSIIGTFLAGFVLIPLLGSTKIIFLLAALLVAAAILAVPKKMLPLKIGAVIVLLGLSAAAPQLQAQIGKGNVIDVDTLYHRVLIYEDTDRETGLPIRVMQTNNEGSSAMFLASDELVYGYTKFYRLAKFFQPNLRAGLMLGGAGYSYPKDFLSANPEATLDVVEIDPGLTELAKKYFRLEDNPRLAVFHEDGRTFINGAEKKYDAFYGDAFKSIYSIPYQLTTLEATQKIYGLLNDGGVAIINVASAVEGRRGEFLRAEYATYRQIFPQVFLFPVTDPNNGKLLQNLILVALKSDAVPTFTDSSGAFEPYLSHLWQGAIGDDLPILTDDYAPVDYYINKVL